MTRRSYGAVAGETVVAASHAELAIGGPLLPPIAVPGDVTT